MTQKKVRWGILSTAKIGTEKVIPAIMKSPSSEVLGIASRDGAKARQAADALGIAKSYGSYEELLADPEIDAIYNPLPNDLHVPLTLQAAEAGKHVLCEKPIGMDAADAEKLRACPDSVIVTEAFMVRYHPQWLRVREIIRSGELGEVRAVQAAFSYFNADPANIRNKPENGGGAIMDIGCYPITAGRFFFEGEPERVLALIDRDPSFGTDRQASVIADFGDGRHLDFIVSTQLAPYQKFHIMGTKARAEIMIPVNAPQGAATTIVIDSGMSLDNTLSRRELIPACDQYTEQAEAMAQAILAGKKLPYGIDDAIASMRVIDAVFASEKSGSWAKV